MTETVTSGLMRGHWRRSDGPLEGDTRPKRGETAGPRTPWTPPRLRPTLLIVGFQHHADAVRFQEELRERLRGFGLELHPEKTRLIVWALRRPEERGAEAREASDLQLSGPHAHLREVTRGEVLAGSADDAGADAGHAAGGESQPTATPASAHPGAGAMAGGGRTRILRVPRCSHQREGAAGVPDPSRTALAALATAARSA
jgi:hypothetical protein